MRESIRIAIRGLRANRLRSALTMLGITIGVAAVIVLVAVGNGSSKAVQRQIESLGTNTLIVLRQGGFGRAAAGRGGTGTISRRTDLNQGDVDALNDKTKAPDVAVASPVVTAQTTVTFQGATYSPQQFVGTTPAYASTRAYSIAEGSLFTDQDVASHKRVAVVGQTVAAQLSLGQDLVGQQLLVNGTSFRVVGLLAAKGSNGLQDQDDVILAPVSAVQDALTGRGPLNQIAVQASSREQMDAAAAEVTDILLTRHKITDPTRADFSVLNQAALLDASSQAGRIFTVLLGAVAAISLLVGGIGVMNIMLVTVTERTREIGIRKAIGARTSDILAQFLAESVLICLLGGLVGVAFGLLASRASVAGLRPEVAPYSIPLAFGVAVAIGLFFGIYPANRAASLRPIEALRHE